MRRFLAFLFCSAVAMGCGDTIIWDDDDTSLYGEDDTFADDDADDDTVLPDDDTADDDADDDTGNAAPTAEAGPSVVIELGDTAYLDGSASSDPDGDSLDFSWDVTSTPYGGSPNIAGATTITPTMMPTLEGDYVVELTVTDPGGLDDTDEITVTVEPQVNEAPVADAGMDQTVTQGDIVHLDGTASFDPNGDSISYWWSFVSYPGATAPTLSSQTSPTPNFIADDEGLYVLQLAVNDGQLSSSPDEVRITSETEEEDPGCLECYAYLPEDAHTPPVRMSMTRKQRASKAGLLALFAACAVTLAWHRRRSV